MTTKKNKLPKPVKAWANSTNLRSVYPYDFSCGTWRFTVPVHIAPVATHATVELAKVREVMRFWERMKDNRGAWWRGYNAAIQEVLQMLALDKVPRYDPQDVAIKPAKAKPARKGKKGTVAK